jgi:hypothetical protein
MTQLGFLRIVALLKSTWQRRGEEAEMMFMCDRWLLDMHGSTSDQNSLPQHLLLPLMLYDDTRL